VSLRRSSHMAKPLRFLIGAFILLLGACSTRGTGPTTGPRTLPVDSARILERAIADARPAYATQAQALGAGVYQRPMLAATPPRPPEQPVHRAEPIPAPRAESPAAPVPPPAPRAPAGAEPTVRRNASPVALLGDETNSAPRPEVSPQVALEHPALSGVAPGAAGDLPAEDRTPGRAVEEERYVIQVAAFRDLTSARRALSDVERALPSLSAGIEEEDGIYRVVVGGWPREAVARERLPAIRESFPTAWVRNRAVP
jgi:hypothetical protein